MRRRPTATFRPDLERVEPRQLLSLGPGPMAHHARVDLTTALARMHHHRAPIDPHSHRTPGYLAYRITNPTRGMVNLVPPFQHVMVQAAQPEPGQMYNILYVAVKNETRRTFTASDNFRVRLPDFTGPGRVAGQGLPVLTGDQLWKPNSWIVFYVLSKQYYPLSNQVASGFQVDAGGRSSTMIPGPSGIALRITYDPATFGRTLDSIVAYGAGALGGPGAKAGLPDTAINALVSARTHRQDFAGHF